MLVLWIALSVNSQQLRNIGRAKCIVCPTNPTVGRATALPAHYVPAPLNLLLLIDKPMNPAALLQHNEPNCAGRAMGIQPAEVLLQQFETLEYLMKSRLKAAAV